MLDTLSSAAKCGTIRERVRHAVHDSVSQALDPELSYTRAERTAALTRSVGASVFMALEYTLMVLCSRT
jgi:hypothetical protein